VEGTAAYLNNPRRHIHKFNNKPVWKGQRAIGKMPSTADVK